MSRTVETASHQNRQKQCRRTGIDYPPRPIRQLPASACAQATGGAHSAVRAESSLALRHGKQLSHQPRSVQRERANAIRQEAAGPPVRCWVGYLNRQERVSQVLADCADRPKTEMGRRLVDYLRDGLKGFDTAINSVFPVATVQYCIVHQLRNSFRFVPDKLLNEFAKDCAQGIRPPTRSRRWKTC